MKKKNINVLEMVQSRQLLLHNSSYLILIISHIVVYEILDYVFGCSVDFSFVSFQVSPWFFCLIENKSHVSVSCIYFSIVLNEYHWILSSKKEMDYLLKFIYEEDTIYIFSSGRHESVNGNKSSHKILE